MKKITKNPNKKLMNFFFELGMLKKLKHCGTKFAGVKYPDSLAEHTCRSAQIGYIMALAIGSKSPGKVATMCLMHDIGEIRVGDTHQIAKKYIQTKIGEKMAAQEQTAALPSPLNENIFKLWTEFDEQKTDEALLARDADLLETMIQAKEYYDTGFKAAKRWLTNGNKHLKTPIAKKLYKTLLKTEFSDWWDGLNKI